MKITIENSKLGTGEVVLFVPDNAYGAVQILVERYRVITEKGRTVEQDAAQYEFGELLHAAASYQFRTPEQVGEDDVPFIWPFSDDSWHGGTDPLADLVRAGQFIAAEIDRLAEIADRAKNPPSRRALVEGEAEEVNPMAMAPASLTEPVKKPITDGRKILKGFRSEGTRLDANPETLKDGVEVFEPGTGSDPATWFEGALLEAQHPAFASQYHEGKRILRCHKTRDAGHESHDWVSSHLPVWCPGSDRSDS